jgi:hypothetical protein
MFDRKTEVDNRLALRPIEHLVMGSSVGCSHRSHQSRIKAIIIMIILSVFAGETKVWAQQALVFIQPFNHKFSVSLSFNFVHI